MAIDTGIAVRMRDIDGIAEAIHVDSQTTDIAVGNGIDEFTLTILCLYINASMEMKRTRLAKVARKDYLVVDGRRICYWLLAISRRFITTRHQ